MIISKTPYRISFFGGGTDYPSWYLENGGSVLATSIDKYCYLTCRYLPPFFEHKYRIVWSKTETANNLTDIQHPVISRVVDWMDIKEGLEIHHDGDLPARSGMGSSSSFVVGLIHVLSALKGQMISKHELLKSSLYLEQDILQENVGSQDQALVTYGGFNKVDFLQTGQIIVHPVTIGNDTQEQLNTKLMLFFSGATRTASKIVETFLSNLVNKKEHLNKIKGLVDQGLKILSTGTDLDEFGYLLHEAWCLKKQLSTSVSTNSCDEIYERACKAGAIGGKLLGAGGGGFMLFYVPLNSQSKVLSALSDLVFVPFKFEYQGSQIIYYEPNINYESNIS